MLQERKTTSTIMLGPLLDKLIQFTHFHVDALGHIKTEDKSLTKNVVSCSKDLKHVLCKMFVVQCVIVYREPEQENYAKFIDDASS